MIPTLETTRFYLRPPSLDCFDAYRQFYTDAIASKMYGGPISEELVRARLKADVGSWTLLGFGVWVIQCKDTQAIVGTCGFWQGYGWPRELTWWILPEFRGQGIATEASLCAIDHAYNQWHWERVETYMNDNNNAARALVEKLGGEIIHRARFSDGLDRNVYHLPNTR